MAEKKVLIVYATRYGSTRIVAGDIQEFLQDKDCDVEVVDLGKERFSGNLMDFDLVIAGSSVAMFHWKRTVKKFLGKVRRAGISAVVYVCCGTAIASPEKARSRYLDRIIDRIGLNPVLSQPISPVIDFRPEQGLPIKLKKRIRGVIQGMAKERFLENGLMDFRNKTRFTGFLDSILDTLKS